MDNSKYHDLNPSPCIFILAIILFSHKKVSLMVIVNIKVCKCKYLYVTMWLMCIYLYYIYIYIQMYVCMYMYMYICKCVSCIYGMSCIYIYMCISSQVDLDLSLVHLIPTPRPPPNWARMFASHASLPGSSDIPLEKIHFWRGKNRDFETKGVDLCPTGGHLCLMCFDWCCFYYFVRNSLVALLEASCAIRFQTMSVWKSPRKPWRK